MARNSIPILHSSAAILKIAEMDYTGANSIFLRIFLDKKYALPYRVVDAVVFHFLRLVFCNFFCFKDSLIQCDLKLFKVQNNILRIIRDINDVSNIFIFIDLKETLENSQSCGINPY